MTRSEWTTAFIQALERLRPHLAGTRVIGTIAAGQWVERGKLPPEEAAQLHSEELPPVEPAPTPRVDTPPSLNDIKRMAGKEKRWLLTPTRD